MTDRRARLESAALCWALARDKLDRLDAGDLGSADAIDVLRESLTGLTLAVGVLLEGHGVMAPTDPQTKVERLTEQIRRAHSLGFVGDVPPLLDELARTLRAEGLARPERAARRTREG